MNAAAIIANLLAGLDLAQRTSAFLGNLREQYLAAKAAGQITAEQDAEITAAYDALRAAGFEFKE